MDGCPIFIVLAVASEALERTYSAGQNCNKATISTTSAKSNLRGVNLRI
jgi:hypothetical protein